MNLRRYWVILVLTGLLLQSLFAKAQDNATGAEALRAMVEADWAAQERRKNRTLDGPAAVRDAYRRAEELLNDLRKMPAGPDITSQAVTLERLRSQVNAVDSLDKRARLALYRQVRSTARNLSLKNPLITSKPIVFMKRRRFICQMLHEYLGYFYDYGDIAGGGVYVLEEPGRSLKVLKDPIHTQYVHLPKEERRRIYIWLDANVPFYGTYEQAQQLAQKDGQAVPPPLLQ